MSHHEGEELSRVQYPLNSDSYRILDEIGVGGSAIIYKAECIPMGSTLVAIKAIDLDQPRTDLDSVVREVKTMTLHSHPNILRAHCSFTVDRRVWIVMPFMSAGSLQSIIASSFPHGLPEPCIAIVLRETLNALAYLHDQGEVHRDIKAGNILVDSNGSVKLADFGASVLIYDNPTSGASGSLTSCFKLTEVAGTPYWMAPEVIHSHNGYGSKADIWSFGITALELAHGRPPLSHLPLSKSLLLKITNRFRNLDCEMSSSDQRKKFSKSFKNMVASCLHHDPCKRPTAEELLKCTFFKNCKSSEFLVNEVLVGLDSVEQRFKKGKLLRELSINFNDADDDAEEKGSSAGENIKQRRISGWNLNEDEFELVPVFPSENPFRKEVRFGGETIIPNPSRVNNPDIPSNPEVRVEARGSNPDNPSNTSSSSPTMEKIKEVQVEGSESNPDNPWNTSSSSPSAEEIKEVQSEGNSSGAPQAAAGSVEAAQPGGSISNYRDPVIALLKNLNESLESQNIVVRGILAQLTGEEVIISREDQLILENERLKLALEQEKRRNTALEMELQFHKI